MRPVIFLSMSSVAPQIGAGCWRTSGSAKQTAKTLKRAFRSLADSLRDASPTFGKLASELLKMKDSQSDVEEVQLRPLPGRLQDLARSVDIVVGAGNGKPALPMRLQGLGSRSLAALRVFYALCELRVGVDQGVRPQLITLLEEPEAHLHPQAQAAMYRFIQDLPGQVVVATHSSVLIGETDLEAVRILRSTKEGTKVHKLDRDTAKKLAVFRRYISRPSRRTVLRTYGCTCGWGGRANHSSRIA